VPDADGAAGRAPPSGLASSAKGTALELDSETDAELDESTTGEPDGSWDGTTWAEAVLTAQATANERMETCRISGIERGDAMSEPRI
jgi:hypothetical protein